MAPADRTSLGRYRILRRLGAGAMGEVYLADDPNIDRQLAIKTVRLGDGGEIEIEERRVRLMREAKAAGRLVHPYVVTLFDAGEAEDGVFYLAFEFVGGPDLSKRQMLQPPLTLGEVLRIGRQAAEGLDAAHRQGIVHRDIKPSNILLDASGQVKISDFGIAKMLGQATELTQTGSVVGSPHYLSPEQIRGEELDGRSDLFSLGVVLYELLTRTRPFSGDTITTLVYQILAREPQPIAGIRPGLPLQVEAIVTRLLQKDRDQRFPSARELVDALAACERELPAAMLAGPAAAQADEMGDTVRMAGTPATGALPPPPPGVRAPTGSTDLWAQGVAPVAAAVSQGTGPTQLWAAPAGSAPPPPPPFGPAAAAAVAPTGGQPLVGGSAVPGSGSYAPAAPPRRFPWGIVAVLAFVGLLGVGGVVGLLLWMNGRGDATGIALQPEGEPQAEATRPEDGVSGATDDARVPAGPGPVPAATFAAPQGIELEEDEEQWEAVPSASTGTGTLHTADRPADGEPRVQPPAPQPVRTAAPPVATPRPEPRVVPTATPRRTEPAPPLPAPPVAEPEPEPEPEPVEQQRFDRELASSLAIKFAVQPPEAVVSVKREGDRRFTVIGRAGDYDADKKKLPAYDLNGPGVHYVRIVHEGREVIYRLQATLGSQVTTLTIDLAPTGRRRR